jgi:hypothetical protein
MGKARAEKPSAARPIAVRRDAKWFLPISGFSLSSVNRFARLDLVELTAARVVTNKP